MEQIIHQKLQQLKADLPKNFQAIIVEKSNNVIRLWQVKGAFAGTYKNEDNLKRILRIAGAMAKERKEQLATLLQEIA